MTLNKNEIEKINNEKHELNNNLETLNKIKNTFENKLNTMQEILDKENEQHTKTIKDFKVQLEKFVLYVFKHFFLSR